MPSVTNAIINAPFSHTLVNGLKNIIVNENPLEIEYLWNKMYESTLYFGRSGAVIQAMAGIDIALWDIKGKYLKLPIYQLLGGHLKKTACLFIKYVSVHNRRYD